VGLSCDVVDLTLSVCPKFLGTHCVCMTVKASLPHFLSLRHRGYGATYYQTRVTCRGPQKRPWRCCQTHQEETSMAKIVPKPKKVSIFKSKAREAKEKALGLAKRSSSPSYAGGYLAHCRNTFASSPLTHSTMMSGRCPFITLCTWVVCTAGMTRMSILICARHSITCFLLWWKWTPTVGYTGA
jgi:hypothetical protein